MTRVPGPSRALLVTSAVLVVAAWVPAVALAFAGDAGLATALFGLGLSLGPCLAGYSLGPRPRKQRWRQLVLATGGLAILAFSLMDAVNLDLDGFLELIFLGSMGAAVGHTLATTIVGPLIFGRLLCGWGCWRAMVLEILPVRHRAGPRGVGWRFVPLVGLGASIAAAAYGATLGHRPGGVPGQMHGESVWPVAVGIAVYYAVAIGAAFVVGDQRAFCKHLCPTGLILRWTSRPALLRVEGSPGLCTGCDACSRACPMDIPVADRVRAGARISRGDCILCQRCVTTCPAAALTTAFTWPGRLAPARITSRRSPL
jgi:ferredoxin-type protein NapH